MPDILLIRHAHVDYRPPATMTAHNELTEIGLEMAQRLAARCEGFALQHLIVSPFRRTRQTADAIIERMPELPFTLLPELAETNRDDLEGYDGELPLDDLRTWGSEHEQYAYRRLLERVRSAWLAVGLLIEESGLERVGIVSHAAALNMLLQSFLSIPVDFANVYRFELGWASVSCIRYDAERRVVRWLNDTRHTDGLRALLP